MKKKILITGINGFIGSNCKNYFSQKGCEIFGIDIFGENSSNFIQGEVNLKNLKSFNQKFDIIIHLAGSGTVGLAQKSPELEYIKTVGSSEHILEYMKNYNQEARLIYSSSASVYGDLYDRPIKETDILNPISIYGKHKVEVEKLCEKYHKKNGLKISIIRFFSIYGEGLRKQLLWDICNKISANPQNIECFGTGKEVRDFIHIKDAVELISVLIESNQSFEVVNGASAQYISVENVVDCLTSEFKYNGNISFNKMSREGDPFLLIADISKSKSIGFNPLIEWIDGVSKYVEWFKKTN